jgi:signal transduction histidine kinase
MTDSKIRTLLLCTILVTTGLPLLAAFYFLGDALERSLNLGFNSQIVQALDAAAQNLKTLKGLDPARAEVYRTQFDQVETLHHVYSQPELLKRALRDSLRTYFGVGLVAAVLMAVIVALFLGRRIHTSYRVTFEELTRHRDRVRYLEQMSSWQELARILAHEIKNPLTPIEVLVTSLSRAHEEQSPAAFREQLVQAQTMIGEEISHLKRTVSHFSDFARLPEAQLVLRNPADVIREHLPAISATYESADLRLHDTECPAGLRANLDSSLFRQVLTNIVANGVEANPGRRVVFDITVTCATRGVRIAIANDGVPVPCEIAAQVFEPYISGKSGKDNVGLGLTIVKKIVVEHGGEIGYVEEDGHPTFVLSLARAA